MPRPRQSAATARQHRKPLPRKTKKPPRLTFTGWATTDEDERKRREQRGRDATDISVKALERSLAPLGRYLVESGDQHYSVEMRHLDQPVNTCSCPDFAVNQLGTCKHIELIIYQKRRQRNRRPAQRLSEIHLDNTESPPTVTWHDLGEWQGENLPDALKLLTGQPRYHPALVTKLSNALSKLPPNQRKRWRLSEALLARSDAEANDLRIAQRLNKMIAASAKGTSSPESKKKATLLDPGIKLPLYPYQREGMLHLLTCRRAILSDEMGLGKTVQAIAACAVLQQLGLAKRVLVVSPASLKSEWQEQIGLFTDLASQVVFGNRRERLEAYREAPFFTLVNYEQVLRDGPDIDQLLAPDIIVLDEAQRIKNWRTKTADAIKKLSSGYAFVLTGTPLENRIDEIYSIMQFVNPEVLGPLFRFNREYYVLNERGNPEGYKQLDQLKQVLEPWLLRRTKDDVEGDLPPCTTRTVLIPMTEEQSLRYADDEAGVARLAATAKRRPLTPDEMKRLQIKLANMRMYCDSVYIRDQSITDSPKLNELDVLLDELLAGKHKIIVFSEWTRMLDLLRMRLDKRGVGYAVHTGDVPQKKRRAEINRFKQDEDCRLFLSTESGGSGLNLQVADVVINLDLPWNPAKLAQRVARAWRKHQTRSVQVINLVASNTIEHRMIARLEAKQRLADAVLSGGLDAMELPSGRGAMLQQIEDLMGERSAANASVISRSPVSSSVDGEINPVTDQASGKQGVTTCRDANSTELPTSTQSPASWQALAVQAVVSFSPVLQHMELQHTDSGLIVMATAVGDHEDIRAYLEAQASPDSASFKVQVIDPSMRTQLDALSAAGVISFTGHREALISEGEVIASEVDANRIGEILKPHIKSAQAAELLESNGFAEQAEEIVQGLIPGLITSFGNFKAADSRPAALPLREWANKTPSAKSLMRALVECVG